MIADIGTVVWKECRELLAERRKPSVEALSAVAALAGLGIIFGSTLGPSLSGSPFVLILTTWVPLLLVSTIVADAFAGERERHTLETLLATRLPDAAILLGKILTIQAYAWALTLGMLVVAVVTANIVAASSTLVVLSPILALGALLTSLLASGMAACAGVLVSLRSPTTRHAQQRLGAGSMLVFLILYSLARVVPIAWLGAVSAPTILRLTVFLVIPLAASLLGLFLLSVHRFRRERLMLD